MNATLKGYFETHYLCNCKIKLNIFAIDYVNWKDYVNIQNQYPKSHLVQPIDEVKLKTGSYSGPVGIFMMRDYPYMRYQEGTFPYAIEILPGGKDLSLKWYTSTHVLSINDLYIRLCSSNSEKLQQL